MRLLITMTTMVQCSSFHFPIKTQHQNPHQLHAHHLKSNLLHNPHYSSHLLPLYITHTKNLSHIHTFFNSIPHPTLLHSNLIITSYIDHNRSNDALLLFRQMLTNNILPLLRVVRVYTPKAKENRFMGLFLISSQ